MTEIEQFNDDLKVKDNEVNEDFMAFYLTNNNINIEKEAGIASLATTSARKGAKAGGFKKSISDFVGRVKDNAAEGLDQAATFAANNPIKSSIGGGAALGAGIGASVKPSENRSRLRNAYSGAILGGFGGFMTSPIALDKARRFLKNKEVDALRLKQVLKPGEVAKKVNRNTHVIYPEKPTRTVKYDPATSYGPGVEGPGPGAMKMAALNFKALGEGAKNLGKHVAGGAGMGAALNTIRETGKDDVNETFGHKAQRLGRAASTGALYGGATGAAVFGVRGLGPAKKELVEQVAKVASKYLLRESIDDLNPLLGSKVASLLNSTNKVVGFINKYPKISHGVGGAIEGGLMGAGTAYATDQDIGKGALIGAGLGGTAGAYLGSRIKPNSTALVKRANIASTAIKGLGGALARAPRTTTAIGAGLLGGATNKAMGGDFTTGAAVGAGLGGLGGQKILNAATNMKNPLFGKAFGRATNMELGAMRAGQNAANSGRAMARALPAPAATPTGNPAATVGHTPGGAGSVIDVTPNAPRPSVVTAQQPKHNPMTSYGPGVEGPPPSAAPASAQHNGTTYSISAQKPITHTSPQPLPSEPLTDPKRVQRMSSGVVEGIPAGNNPGDITVNLNRKPDMDLAKQLSGIKPPMSKKQQMQEVMSAYDQAIANNGPRRSINPRFM